MARDGSIERPWGDADRTFRLGVAEWRKVQEKCDAGPPEIAARLAPPFEAMQRGATVAQLIGLGLLGRWRIDDVREPLYQGLIGGGLDPTAAGKLVRELFDDRGAGAPFENLGLAYEVVLASILGPEDEKPGEGEGGAASPA